MFWEKKEIETIVDYLAKDIGPQYPDITIESIKEGIWHYVNQYIKAKQSNDSSSVAYSFHCLIDDLIKEYSEKDPAWKKVPCRMGCNHCCKMSVCITSEEADLLIDHAKEKKIQINKNILLVQSRFDTKSWVDLKGKYKDCIFLKNGKCQVYEYRPSACRSHYQIGDPQFCDIQKHQGMKVPVWRPLIIQVIACAITIAGQADYMPRNLLRSLGLAFKEKIQ